MTISDIKSANKRAGFYFFERATMRFFDSRVERSVYVGPNGVYFLTSEQFHGSCGSAPRKWTVRKFNPATGDITTPRDYNRLTREEAREEAKRLARGVTR